jgi:hypothetical protein
MRKAGPVNRERMARFNRIEAECGGKPDVERVLSAFLSPISEVGGQHPEFTRMMGRMQAEGILSDVIARTFKPVLNRFLGLLRQAVPAMSEEEFRWRVYFMQGALAQTMCGEPGAMGAPLKDEGLAARMERLIVFLGGAFRAPQSRKTNEKSAHV